MPCRRLYGWSETPSNPVRHRQRTEKAKHGRDDGAHLEGEQPPQLEWSQERKRHVDEPVEEEAKELLRREANRQRHVIGDICEMMAKDASHHDHDEARASVELHRVPEDC